MKEFSKYVGMDTHKDTIAVAVAEACGGKPRYYGEIPNTAEAVAKLVKKLSPEGEVVSFCYEEIVTLLNSFECSMKARKSINNGLIRDGTVFYFTNVSIQISLRAENRKMRKNMAIHPLQTTV